MATKKPIKMQKAKIYDAEGRTHQIEFDVADITIPNDYCTNGELDIFQIKHRVPDVLRYEVKVCNKKVTVSPLSEKKVEGARFNDVLAKTVDFSDDKRTILLILESPHRDEYEHDEDNHILTPKAPAQGSTGTNIENHINDVLGEIADLYGLADGCYRLIISNPIPYMCSLGNSLTETKNKKLRDNIWEAIWNIKDEGIFVIQKEFIDRCKKYNPKYIINCCTETLKVYVTDKIIKNFGNLKLYEAPHPSSNHWNKTNGIFKIKQINNHIAYIRKENNKWKGKFKRKPAFTKKETKQTYKELLQYLKRISENYALVQLMYVAEEDENLNFLEDAKNYYANLTKAK